MYGNGDSDASTIDMLIDVSVDLRLGLARKAYTEPDFVSYFAKISPKRIYE